MMRVEQIIKIKIGYEEFSNRQAQDGLLGLRFLMLLVAKESGGAINFNYQNAKGEISNRTIHPKGLKEMGQSFCVEGNCTLKNAYRSFDIQRMSNLAVVE